MADQQEVLAHLKTLDVLYVEDDLALAGSTAAFLERRVGRLRHAADGVLGLEAFRAAGPDLVITDIRMPRMDGLTMVEAMRELSPAIPVVVTTAFEQTDYLMRAIKLGVDRYVLKPVDPDLLMEALLACAGHLLAESQAAKAHQLELENAHLHHQKALRILLTGVAHDYNNLSQSLYTAAFLAQWREGEAPSVSTQSPLIEDSMRQIKHLSRRLLKLVQKEDALSHAGSLETLLELAIAGIRQEPGWTTEVIPSAQPLTVRYNPENLHLVFSHLAQNAKDATGGKGHLKATLGSRTIPADVPRLSPGDYVEVTLADDGKGIPADALPMIFEPYFTTKQRGSQRGTGLGLALCEAIVRGHGGGIQAESAEGQGTTIKVLLPVVSAGA